MKLVDDVAGVVASRHSSGAAVTASMDEMDFVVASAGRRPGARRGAGQLDRQELDGGRRAGDGRTLERGRCRAGARRDVVPRVRRCRRRRSAAPGAAGAAGDRRATVVVSRRRRSGGPTGSLVARPSRALATRASTALDPDGRGRLSDGCAQAPTEMTLPDADAAHRRVTRRRTATMTRSPSPTSTCRARPPTTRDFLTAALLRCRADGLQLRRARFVETLVVDLQADDRRPGRVGLARLTGHRRTPRSRRRRRARSWSRLRLRGVKLDFLNLRGATLQDVVFQDCVLGEIDASDAQPDRRRLHRRPPRLLRCAQRHPDEGRSESTQHCRRSAVSTICAVRSSARLSCSTWRRCSPTTSASWSRKTPLPNGDFGTQTSCFGLRNSPFRGSGCGLGAGVGVGAATVRRVSAALTTVGRRPDLDSVRAVVLRADDDLQHVPQVAHRHQASARHCCGQRADARPSSAGRSARSCG